MPGSQVELQVLLSYLKKSDRWHWPFVHCPSPASCSVGLSTPAQNP